MASLSFDKAKGRWRIQFLAPDSSRRSVSMKATRARDKGQSKAAAFKNHIEELSTAIKSGTTLSPQVDTWVHKLPMKTHAQLVDAGLLAQRLDPELSKLGPFLNKWFTDRAGTKASTVITWRNAERNMLSFFGSDKLLTGITEDDGEGFERYLKSQVAEATARKRLSISKQFLSSAIKARILAHNPFDGLRTANKTNRKRQHFVTPQETEPILSACTNAEWRTLVTLARYGALRIPSESAILEWDDINWGESCVHVHAPKTEHHEDEGDRIVPLFPELRHALTELWEETPPGEVFVLPNLRHTTNPLTTLTRIIKRAGVKPFPKAWINMRATRATELENEFGSHKATEWCGHTEKIAEAHYWMVTADDVSKAAEWCSGGAHVVQQGAETGGNASQPDLPAHEKTPVFPGSATDCEELRPVLMGDEGLEPPTPSV